MSLSGVVLQLRRKNEISENESWLLWQRPLKIQKSMLRSFIYSHSGTEWWKPRENPSSESQDNWADRNLKKNNKIRKQNMWLTGSLLRSQTSMYNEQLWATKHEHKKLNYHQHSSFLKMARNQHPTAGSCQNRHLWFESLKNSFIFALIYIKLF